MNDTKKCFAHNHMTATQYAVWDVCRSLSHESGILFFNGRNVAARFKGMSKSTAYRVADELTGQGWFILVKNTRRRKDGTWTPKQYRVLAHAEWVTKHPTACADLQEVEPVPITGLDDDEPVPPAKRPVPFENQPVPPEGHNLKLTTYIRPTDVGPVPITGQAKFDSDQGEVNKFIDRYTTKKSDRAIAIATQFHPAPVPITGQAALDTQTEAVRVSGAICATLGLDLPILRTNWASAVKSILDKGHTSEMVINGARFILEHPNFGPSAMRKNGPEAFARDFGDIVQGMKTSAIQQPNAACADGPAIARQI